MRARADGGVHGVVDGVDLVVGDAHSHADIALGCDGTEIHIAHPYKVVHTQWCFHLQGFELLHRESDSHTPGTACRMQRCLAQYCRCELLIDELLPIRGRHGTNLLPKHAKRPRAGQDLRELEVHRECLSVDGEDRRRLELAGASHALRMHQVARLEADELAPTLFESEHGGLAVGLSKVRDVVLLGLGQTVKDLLRPRQQRTADRPTLNLATSTWGAALARRVRRSSIRSCELEAFTHAPLLARLVDGQHCVLALGRLLLCLLPTQMRLYLACGRLLGRLDLLFLLHLLCGRLPRLSAAAVVAAAAAVAAAVAVPAIVPTDAVAATVAATYAATVAATVAASSMHAAWPVLAAFAVVRLLPSKRVLIKLALALVLPKVRAPIDRHGHLRKQPLQEGHVFKGGDAVCPKVGQLEE